MEKTYMEFVEQLCREIRNTIGLKEQDVYFKKSEDYPQTEGDRIFVTCLAWESSREVFGLYSEDLYESFCKGTGMEEMVDFAKEQYDGMQESGCLKKVRNIRSYENARKQLFVRLMNYEMNKEELQNAIFRKAGDIAMVVYMGMGTVNGNEISMKVLKPVAEEWGINEETLFENAKENMRMLTPPRFWNLQKLLFEPEYEGEDFMKPGSIYEIQGVTGECLSTTQKMNGAAALFFSGVAERVAELVGSGFYAVFTSIHEVMIHDDREVTVEKLRLALENVLEEATEERDFLTRMIGHYHQAIPH